MTPHRADNTVLDFKPFLFNIDYQIGIISKFDLFPTPIRRFRKMQSHLNF